MNQKMNPRYIGFQIGLVGSQPSTSRRDLPALELGDGGDPLRTRGLRAWRRAGLKNRGMSRSGEGAGSQQPVRCGGTGSLAELLGVDDARGSGRRRRVLIEEGLDPVGVGPDWVPLDLPLQSNGNGDSDSSGPIGFGGLKRIGLGILAHDTYQNVQSGESRHPFAGPLQSMKQDRRVNSGAVFNRLWCFDEDR